MESFMRGMISAGFLVSALFFLRFWRKSHDRLFAIFSISFLILGLNRFLITLVSHGSEAAGYLYLVRLVAFTLILAAIIEKNIKR